MVEYSGKPWSLFLQKNNIYNIWKLPYVDLIYVYGFGENVEEKRKRKNKI